VDPRRVKEWKRTGARPAVSTLVQTAQFLEYISGHWLYAPYTGCSARRSQARSAAR
jgi:hypothetical protein